MHEEDDPADTAADHRSDATAPGAPLTALEAPLTALEAEMAATWQRSRAAVRALAAAVHPRLDPTAYPLIALLRRAGGMRPSEIGDVLHLDRPTVTRQVDAAERLGLVARGVDPRDARARLVDLTPHGRERADSVHEERLDRWRTALSTWPPGDVTELTRLLRQLGRLGPL